MIWHLIKNSSRVSEHSNDQMAHSKFHDVMTRPPLGLEAELRGGWAGPPSAAKERRSGSRSPPGWGPGRGAPAGSEGPGGTPLRTHTCLCCQREHEDCSPDPGAPTCEALRWTQGSDFQRAAHLLRVELRPPERCVQTLTPGASEWHLSRKYRVCRCTPVMPTGLGGA